MLIRNLMLLIGLFFCAGIGAQKTIYRVDQIDFRNGQSIDRVTGLAKTAADIQLGAPDKVVTAAAVKEALDALPAGGGGGGVSEATVSAIVLDSIREKEVTVSLQPRYTGLRKTTESGKGAFGFDPSIMPYIEREPSTAIMGYDPDGGVSGLIPIDEVGEESYGGQGIYKRNDTFQLGTVASDFGLNEPQFFQDRGVKGLGTTFSMYGMDLEVGQFSSAGFYGTGTTAGFGRLVLGGQPMFGVAAGTYRCGGTVYSAGGQSGLQRYILETNAMSSLQNSGYFSNNDVGSMAWVFSLDNANEPNPLTATARQIPFWIRRDGVVRLQQQHTEYIQHMPRKGGTAEAAYKSSYVLPDYLAVNTTTTAPVVQLLDGYGTSRPISGTTPSNARLYFDIALTNTSSVTGTSFSRYMVGWTPTGITISVIAEGVSLDAPRLEVVAGALIVRLNGGTNTHNVLVSISEQGLRAGQISPTNNL